MRNRWMRTSMLAVGLVLVLVFVLFSVLVASYYYSTIRTGLETKAQTSTLLKDVLLQNITKQTCTLVLLNCL